MRRLKQYIELIFQLKDTPESIARGVAIGMFVAMTPTVGIQMLIVLFLSLFIPFNRVAGLIMVYISNPLTLVPIYWLDYWTGALLFGYPLVGIEDFKTLFQFQSSLFYEQFLEFLGKCLALGAEVYVPMFLGGIIWGLALGIPLYPLTLWLIRKYRSRKGETK